MFMDTGELGFGRIFSVPRQKKKPRKDAACGNFFRFKVSQNASSNYFG